MIHLPAAAKRWPAYHGGGITGPAPGFCGNDGSVMGGPVCVPEVVLYSSVVPPRSVPHPLNIKALHTIDNNNAIFMETTSG
ncbi:MAG TPA: hypothetical protein VGI88_11870 [Verrucomicrobiae bacterium]